MKTTMQLIGMLFLVQSVLCLPLDPVTTEAPSSTTLAPDTNSSTTTSAPANATTTDHPMDAAKHPVNCTHMHSALLVAPASPMDLIEVTFVDKELGVPSIYPYGAEADSGDVSPGSLQTRAAGTGTDALIQSITQAVKDKIGGPISSVPVEAPKAAPEFKPEETPKAAPEIKPEETLKAAPETKPDETLKAASDNKTEEIPTTTAAPVNTTEEIPKLATRSAGIGTDALIQSLSQKIQDKIGAPKIPAKTEEIPKAAAADIKPEESLKAAPEIKPEESPKAAPEIKPEEIPTTPASLNKTEEIPTTPASVNQTEEIPKLATRAAEEKPTESLVDKISQWVHEKISPPEPKPAEVPKVAIDIKAEASPATPDPEKVIPDNKTAEVPKNDTKVTRDAEKDTAAPKKPVLDDAKKLKGNAPKSPEEIPSSSVSKVTSEAEKSVVTSNSTESAAEPEPVAPAALDKTKTKPAPTQTDKIIGEVLGNALAAKKSKHPAPAPATKAKRSVPSGFDVSKLDPIPITLSKEGVKKSMLDAKLENKQKKHIIKRSYGSSAAPAQSDTKYAYAVRTEPAPITKSAAPEVPAARSAYGAPVPVPEATTEAPTTSSEAPTPASTGYDAPAPAAPAAGSGYEAPAPASPYGYAAPAQTAAAPARSDGRYKRATWAAPASDSSMTKKSPSKLRNIPTVLSAPSKVSNSWA